MTGWKTLKGRWKGTLSLALVLVVCALAILVNRSTSSPTPPLSLEAPYQTANPLISVTVSLEKTLAAEGAFQIDIDLNHDGQFTGAGERGYVQGRFDKDGKGSARLHGLVHGVYEMRARFTLSSGIEVVSPVQSVTVLPPPTSRIPVSFEANKGQADGRVLFQGRMSGQMVHITATETFLVSALPGGEPKLPKVMGDATWEEAYKPRPTQVQRFRLVGANTQAVPTGDKKLPGKSNYFIGNKPENWRTDIEQYQEVVTRGVYQGIDLVYHSDQGRLEYDFHVAPGVDPSVITLEFPDVARLTIDEDGGLVLHTPKGDNLRKSAPVMYQKRGDNTEAVKGDWVLKGEKQAGYVVVAYDRERELVIDPILLSTWIGATGFDQIHAAKADLLGNLYVAGKTTSNAFPTSGPPFDSTLGGGQDVFVTKINNAGTAIIYSTYLGGSASDGPVFGGLGIDVNLVAGEVVITSETSSNDFPTVAPFQAAITFFNDAFVTKLNAAGNALIFSTYLGSNGFDFGNAVSYDGGGNNIYVAGNTTNGLFAPFFPTTPGAVQTVYGGGGLKGDAYVAKFSAAGAMMYCTLIGGSADEEAQAVSVFGNTVYVAGITASNNFPTTAGAFQTVFGGGGQDLFVTKVLPGSATFIFSTYLGGSGVDGKNALTFGAPMGLATDGSGNAWIASGSNSPNYPVTPGVIQPALAGGSDGVVTMLDFSGNLVWSTYLGGAGTDIFYALHRDGPGNIYVIGDTASATYPLVSQLQAYKPPFANVAISKLNPTGTALLFSTPLGGGIDSGRGITLDFAGNIWVAGQTVGASFPKVGPQLMAPTGGFKSFVAKIGPGGPGAGVTIVESGGSTNVAEGGATDTYTVVLNLAPTANVTITLNPGTQVTVAPAVLTFTPANWNVPQTVTVTAVDDLLVEGPHTGTITHTAASADAAYNAIAIASVTANITDNDGVPPTPPSGGGGEGTYPLSAGLPGSGGEGSFGFGASGLKAAGVPLQSPPRTSSPEIQPPRLPQDQAGTPPTAFPVLFGPCAEPAGAKVLVFNISNLRPVQTSVPAAGNERSALGWTLLAGLALGLTALAVKYRST